MEAILHIEPITRETRAPLSVGHTDYLFFGEKLDEDGENVGNTASHLRLGCPMESMDLGSTRSSIPLVKTIECSPDFTRNEGHVYSETLHFLKDRKYLIPYRSKIRSGLGQGLRISHLPSLNFIRHDLTGLDSKVCDPKSDIVANSLLFHPMFQGHQAHPLRDWIAEDLNTNLSKRTVTEISFDTGETSLTIGRYLRQLQQTPTEINSRHLRDIANAISPEVPLLPITYRNNDPIYTSLGSIRDNLTVNNYDLKSYGRIPVQRLERIEYNPFAFRSICEMIDYLPLTDFNVDIVVSPSGDIEFWHEHLAVDRIGSFDDEREYYTCDTILQDYFNEPFLNDVLEKFFHHHEGMTSEIQDLLMKGYVKIKIIKTITDEACVLLYKGNSQKGDAPLCGVYFDIALLSLAPMSIVPELIPN